MLKELENCNTCPHKCNINRKEKVGRCKGTDKIKIALCSCSKVIVGATCK